MGRLLPKDLVVLALVALVAVCGDSTSAGKKDGPRTARHDPSSAIYVPTDPTSLDPEFALRFAAALVYARRAGILTQNELNYITSSFRSQEEQAAQRAAYKNHPEKFPHAPGSASTHRIGLTADIGNVNPLTQPDLIANLAIALEKEGLYFPFLDDPVHVEVHPRSALAYNLEFGYFGTYGADLPPRLPYVEQLRALQAAAVSVRAQLELAARDITLSANATRIVDRFIDDVSKAFSTSTSNEEEATRLMAPVVGGMYALYRARQFPTSFRSTDVGALTRLYNGIGKQYNTAKNQLVQRASLDRRQDATAKLGGWTLLRPVQSGHSTQIRSADERWSGFVISHPEIWHSGTPAAMLKEAVRIEREAAAPRENASTATGPGTTGGSELFYHMITTIQVNPGTERMGPVHDGGTGTPGDEKKP